MSQRSPWRLRCCLPGCAPPQVGCLVRAMHLSTSPPLAGMAATPLAPLMQTVLPATLQDRTCCCLTLWALLPAGCSGLQGRGLTLFGDHVEHLCCHPGYRMLALRGVPQMPAASVGFTTFTWEGTLKRLRQMQVTGQRLGPCSPPCNCYDCCLGRALRCTSPLGSTASSQYPSSNAHCQMGQCAKIGHDTYGPCMHLLSFRCAPRTVPCRCPLYTLYHSCGQPTLVAAGSTVEHNLDWNLRLNSPGDLKSRPVNKSLAALLTLRSA